MIEVMSPKGMELYGRLCGRVLAYAHARAGDRVEIAGYLGSSSAFENAMSEFADAYAVQNTSDHRALVDAIPSRVLDALRPRPFAPALPAYQQVSRQPVAPPMIARTQLVSWRVWAARRGWLYYDNAREIVERFNHGPVPGGRFTDAFVGKFGTLPCFGWRWIAGTGPRPQVRHVICLRQPGLTFPTVRLTQEDALLAELVGRGDIEVGDPTFDDRWRVTAEEPEAAREVLTPGVWRLFASPQLPPFGQVWFERDVAAVVTEGPIAPESVDGYLRFLHNVMGAVAD